MVYSCYPLHITLLWQICSDLQVGEQDVVGKAAGMTGRQVGTPLHLAVLPLLQTAAGPEICAPRMGGCPSLPGDEVIIKGEWVNGQLIPNRYSNNIFAEC